MSRIALTLALLAANVVGQTVADLNLTLQSGGQSLVVAGPGSSVSYSVLGELSESANEGLAMFAFDLSFSGGPLAAADTPTTAPMSSFAVPLGVNNPAGFGGTPSSGQLLQVGGAQNTISNTLGPYPIGAVVTGVALPNQPVELVAGSLVAPLTPGTYTLAPANLLANAIRQGETGVPFWRVDPVGLGTVTPLTVEVVSLTADVASLSLTSPGTQTLTLNAGGVNAGRTYWLLGTVSGTSPGISYLGFNLPLNYDWYFQFTLDLPNGPVLFNSLGQLDGQGRATSLFVLPPGLPLAWAGVVVHHAFYLPFPLDFTSNARECLLTP